LVLSAIAPSSSQVVSLQITSANPIGLVMRYWFSSTESWTVVTASPGVVTVTIPAEAFTPFLSPGWTFSISFRADDPAGSDSVELLCRVNCPPTLVLRSPSHLLLQPGATTLPTIRFTIEDCDIGDTLMISVRVDDSEKADHGAVERGPNVEVTFRAVLFTGHLDWGAARCRFGRLLHLETVD
jgi:hypothetical protein